MRKTTGGNHRGKSLGEVTVGVTIETTGEVVSSEVVVSQMITILS